MKKAVTKSWKTTALGIAGAVGLVLLALHAQLDADPDTIANWGNTIAEAAAMIGIGAMARDSDVTSEEAGAA